MISVPGAYAAGEARLALAEGMHVFLFSDNVPIEDEVDLKHAARQRDLLVMGPDCGTAILNGVGFGFANVVRRGSVGIVGASGTGIQEVASLVHQAGQGISHAIGTGSRDLHAAVGGITTLQAIGLLRDDPRTETIVLVSKPSDRDVANGVLRALAETGKRAVACLQSAADVETPAGVAACRQPRRLPRAWQLARDRHRTSETIGSCWCAARARVCSVAARCARRPLACWAQATSSIDFGDDRYTRGRAHPMIDPTLRNQAIVAGGPRCARRRAVARLHPGLGAHADPAGAALPAIRGAAVQRQRAVTWRSWPTSWAPTSIRRASASRGCVAVGGVQVCASNYAAAVARERARGIESDRRARPPSAWRASARLCSPTRSPARAQPLSASIGDRRQTATLELAPLLGGLWGREHRRANPGRAAARAGRAPGAGRRSASGRGDPWLQPDMVLHAGPPIDWAA